jgi:hypothetical protein
MARHDSSCGKKDGHSWRLQAPCLLTANVSRSIVLYLEITALLNYFAQLHLQTDDYIPAFA